ncbi:MAG: terminase large subunit, partial [Pseudomonadota bacterium]
MAVSLACPNWWEMLKAGQTPLPDLDLNLDRAREAVNVFNRLRLPDVPGQPTMGDAAADWFRDTVAVIFGTVNDDGRRWVREFFELVPKKNSKTTKGSGIMVTALLVNRRPRAEFFLIGPTQQIADTSFRQAAGMIETDPYLRKLLKVRDYDQSIEHMQTKALLRIVSFDVKVMTGTKPVGVLVDELHVLGKNRHASRVIEQIRSGLNVNSEGFLIFITTQSDEPPTGVFKTELEYARGIRDGEFDGDMLPILYEFPLEVQIGDDEAWKNPQIWHAVHPNLGKTRHIADLQSEYEKAARKGVDDVSIWLSQNLNIEIGIAFHKDRWRGVDFWLSAADPVPVTLASLLERCEVITAGVDGGGLDDLLGLSFIGRCKATKNYLMYCKAWAHPSVF